MAFNIHNNPYSILIKSCKGVKNHCVLKQEDVYKKATQGSYIDTCYAGVREFIYPLYNGQKNIGFISVSGYKTDNYKDYLKSVSIKYDISYRKLKNVYVQLETHFPRKEDIVVLILPL